MYTQLAVEQLLEVKYLYHRNVHSTNQLIRYPPLHSPIQWSIVTNSRHHDNSIAGQLPNLWYVHVQVGYHTHTHTVHVVTHALILYMYINFCLDMMSKNYQPYDNLQMYI